MQRNHKVDSCQHNELFEQCEAETSLYARFKLMVHTYDLLPINTCFDENGGRGENDRSSEPGLQEKQSAEQNAGNAEAVKA